MEITTSWERKGIQKGTKQVALNSLREGLSIEMVVQIIELTVERIQQLQAQLQAENELSQISFQNPLTKKDYKPLQLVQ